MQLKFTKNALQDLVFWKIANAKTATKIANILREMQASPYSGKGKPEQLKGILSGYWSRRINQKDRIVFVVNEQEGVISIVSMRGRSDFHLFCKIPKWELIHSFSSDYKNTF